MALELNGTTGVSLVQDGVVTAADLASTLDLSGKTVTLPASQETAMVLLLEDTDGATNASSIEFDLSQYTEYASFYFELNGYYVLNPHKCRAQVRDTGDASFSTTSGDYEMVVFYGGVNVGISKNSTPSASDMPMHSTSINLGNTNQRPNNFQITILNAHDASTYTTVHCHSSGIDSSDQFQQYVATGIRNSLESSEAIQFINPGATLNYSSYRFYGIK